MEHYEGRLVYLALIKETGNIELFVTLATPSGLFHQVLATDGWDILRFTLKYYAVLPHDLLQNYTFTSLPIPDLWPDYSTNESIRNQF